MFDLLDDNDAEYKHFMARKATIMTNLEHLAVKKYQDDTAKQQELIDQVVSALDKEEANYRSMRQTLKRTVRRETLKRKDLTVE